MATVFDDRLGAHTGGQSGVTFAQTNLVRRILFHSGGKVGSTLLGVRAVCESPVSGDVISGQVEVRYRLVDDDLMNQDIKVEFSTNNGVTFQTCTQGAGGEGTTGLAASAEPGTPHVFLWDSLTDGVRVNYVRVRITVLPDLDVCTTSLFVVRTASAPTGTTMFAPTTAQSGDISIPYTLFDDESDLADILVRFSTDGGTTFFDATRKIGAGDPTEDLTTSPAGVAHTYVWDSRADFNPTVGFTIVQFTPSDQFVTGAPFLTASFLVDNVTDDGWVQKQVPEIVYTLDPDGFARFMAQVLEFERLVDRDITISILDLLDPDTTPPQFLPFLADLLGWKLFSEDSETSQRLQLKSAIQIYKQKGLKSAFEDLFRSLGYDAEAIPIWVNPHDPSGYVCDTTDRTVECNTPPGHSTAPFFPHSRIDLKLTRIDPTATLFPDQITEIFRRLEEVRPIHVLIREISSGFSFMDAFTTPTDTTSAPLFRLCDRGDQAFFALGTTPPSLIRYYGARPSVRHDGLFLNRHGDYVDPICGELFKRNGMWGGINEASLILHDGAFAFDRSAAVSWPHQDILTIKVSMFVGMDAVIV